jgi:hypothetical protein
MCYRHNLAGPEGGPWARWAQRITVMGLWIWKLCYTSLLMFWNTFMVIIKIISLIGTWRTTQENSTTTILYGSGLG